ncbi:MAG: nuclear transport factor 2 family protein [Candidatus Binataceae bacterium]|nr:nuclear transport factor 2 family protein [Candidatus Binataceae bacterium]
MADSDSSVRQQLSELIFEYGAMLDDRRMEQWLRLFAEELSYRVIMRNNLDRGEPFYLINENRIRLTQRVQAYREQSGEPSLHLMTNLIVAADDREQVKAGAAALILRNGRIAFAGRYQFDCVKLGEHWKIQELLLSLEGESTPEIITTPV